MNELSIAPVDRPFQATIAPPGSKSLSNRALVLAALADGVCELTNLLLADDTQVMLDGLAKLGFQLDIDAPSHRVAVHGRGGEIPAEVAEIFCGNSGTTIRFLAALCSLGHGQFTLDGVPRMRQRPIGALSAMLHNLGARVEHSPEADGFPPLRILADGLPGGLLRYGSEVSSQFLSAILMVAPYARHEVRIDLDGRQTSWPYVAMTMQLMDIFGHTPELLRDPKTGQPRQIVIPHGKYSATNYAIEPDASNAAYFLATAAVHPNCRVTIDGLGKSSLQGDVRFADVLGQMGAHVEMRKASVTVTGGQTLEGIEIDLSDMPDQGQTLAAVALFASGRTTIHGLHTLRVKETDRLAALSNELSKFGASVSIRGDSLLIDPPEQLRPAVVETYDDHRMAMSFAVAATRIPGVTILNPQCVNKTYPQFFDDLRRILEGT